MIKVVVFDFDGTLVRSNAIKAACMASVAAREPGGAEALAAARALGGNRYRLFAEVARRLHPQAPDAAQTLAAQMIARYTRCCARGIIAAPGQDKARRVILALRRRGCRVFINSATPHVDLPELLVRRRLMPLLDGWYGGPRSKAANLRAIGRRTRAAPRQILMVGDGPDDKAGAQNAGTWFVALTREGRLADRGPFAINDISLVVALLRRQWPRVARPAAARGEPRRPCAASSSIIRARGLAHRDPGASVSGEVFR